MACHLHVNHFFESSLFTMNISSWMIFNLKNYVPLGKWTLSNLSSSATIVPQGKWAQVLQELMVLEANGCFSSIFFANIFPNFHSICAFHPWYANLFMHIMQHFFQLSIVKCCVIKMKITYWMKVEDKWWHGTNEKLHNGWKVEK